MLVNVRPHGRTGGRRDVAWAGALFNSIEDALLYQLPMILSEFGFQFHFSSSMIGHADENC